VKWREWLATEYTTHEPRSLNPQRSIRDARYKLTVTLLKDPAFQWPEEIPLAEYQKIQRKAATGEFIEFYDLKADPYEFKNLAGQPQLKTVQDRLFNELQNWRAQTQDPLLDLAALRGLVFKERNAPPTPVPAWKKEKQANPARKQSAERGAVAGRETNRWSCLKPYPFLFPREWRFLPEEWRV